MEEGVSGNLILNNLEYQAWKTQKVNEANGWCPKKAKSVHQPGCQFYVLSSLLIEERGGPRTEAAHALALIVCVHALECCFYAGKYT